MTWLALMTAPRSNGPPAQDEVDYQPGHLICVHTDAEIDPDSFSVKMRTKFLIFHTDIPVSDCIALNCPDAIHEDGVDKEVSYRWTINLDILEHQAAGAWRAAIVKARNPAPPPTFAQLVRDVPAATVEAAIEDSRDGLGTTWAAVRAHRDNIPLDNTIPLGPNDPELKGIGNRDESDRVPVVVNRAAVMRGGVDRHEVRTGAWRVKLAKRGPHHINSGANG